jgi:hypothetical protein
MLWHKPSRGPSDHLTLDVTTLFFDGRDLTSPSKRPGFFRLWWHFFRPWRFSQFHDVDGVARIDPSPRRPQLDDEVSLCRFLVAECVF